MPSKSIHNFVPQRNNEWIEQSVNDKYSANNRTQVYEELSNFSVLSRDYHFNGSVVQNDNDWCKVCIVWSFLIVIQWVWVTIINFLVDIVHELVRYNFQEVEVVMRRIFGFVFELIIDFAVFHKHVEDGMFSMVYSTKCINYNLLLTLIAKCYRVYFMIHLEFKFLVVWFLHI